MVVPYAHVADFAAAEPETLAEMMRLAQRVQTALENTYHPEGFNLGMNLGRAAGAGITGHLHLHVLPRWVGRREFHDGRGRDARRAGRAFDYLRTIAQGPHQLIFLSSPICPENARFRAMAGTCVYWR